MSEWIHEYKIDRNNYFIKTRHTIILSSRKREFVAEKSPMSLHTVSSSYVTLDIELTPLSEHAMKRQPGFRHNYNITISYDDYNINIKLIASLPKSITLLQVHIDHISLVFPNNHAIISLCLLNSWFLIFFYI